MMCTCLLLVLLVSSPLFVFGQIHIDALEQALAEQSNQGPDKFSKVLYDAFIQDLFTHYLMEGNNSSSNSSCWEDFLSLSSYKQELKVVGSKTLDLNRLSVAIDSFGKPRAGVFKGNTKLLGDFDECLSVKTSDLNITMQYCELPITVIVDKLPLSFAEAVCIPTTCSLSDFNGILPVINEYLIQHGAFVIMQDLSYCTSQGSTKYSAGAIIMFIICFMFLILVLSATMVDVIQAYLPKDRSDNLSGIINTDQNATDADSLLLNPNKRPSRLKTLIIDLIKGFSLYTTLPTLLSTDQPSAAITSINGMRVISMFWIIMCHTYFFSFEYQSFSNSMFVFTDFVSRFASQPILNGFFAVDSFFFLSGLLVAYLTFRQMQRSKGRFPYLPFYIHRILRLTPTYMFVLFFYWFVTVHLGSGPALKNSVGPGSHADQSCRRYWWTNLLYINNFYPTKFMDECMGWAWYLANDMQFYVISPLLLVPLYHWLPVGLVAVVVTLLASFGVTGFIAGHYGYSMNTFHFLVDTAASNANVPDQSSQIYAKPYCRVAPYVVGIVLGYVLFKKYIIPVKRSYIGILVYSIVWGLAFVFGMSTIYGIYSDWHGHHISTAENVLYYMFARFTWGLTLFLVVFACHNGYGGVVNKFLSLPIWVPLGRLTFNAYLVHEIIMVLIFSDLRTPLYYTDMNFILYIIGAIVLAYGASAVVTVFVEFPLSNVEAAVFKALGAPLRSSRNEKKLVRSESPLDTKPETT